MIRYFKRFISWEASSGLLIILAMMGGIIVSNAPIYPVYDDFQALNFTISIGTHSMSKTTLQWINDGLMAIFFLMIGLEMKYNLIEGVFSEKRQVLLPAIASISGVIISLSIYACFNINNPIAMKGWAIPFSADTAFILAILSFFPYRVPYEAKLFVVALALTDDACAMVTLALFYSTDIHMVPLLIALVIALFTFVLNKMGVRKLNIYGFLGFLLWIAIVHSGINGTIAGVILAMMMPVRVETHSPVQEMQNGIQPFVSYVVLPLFAFFNSEVPLHGVSSESFTSPIVIGIFCGLVIGKPLGIFVTTYLLTKIGLFSMPQNISWRIFRPICILNGIGFTFSLFIGTMAFSDINTLKLVRLAVILSTLFSALLAVILLIDYHGLKKRIHDAFTKSPEIS